MSVIQNTIQTLSSPLSHIINLSYFSNYRPVSVLPAFSKIFEKVFYNRLSDYLSKLNIRCDNQYGFRKGYSTSFALIDLYGKISLALDTNEFAVGIFTDLSKAFDTVNYEILYKKLKHYGICGTALEWIKSYLSDRYQLVHFGGYTSSPQVDNMWGTSRFYSGPLAFSNLY